jgi:PAS domain S-box-containing protein
LDCGKINPLGIFIRFSAENPGEKILNLVLLKIGYLGLFVLSRLDMGVRVSEELFVGGGEMGALMRKSFGVTARLLDGPLSTLGPVEDWPQSLKTAISIILNSRYPMFIWWGREMINFYNDAYIPILGQRHPTALGQSAFEVWSDVWDVVGPQAEAVINEGVSSWNEERLLIMERNGFPEETYFTFSYSPIMNDDQQPGGVFCAVTEETKRVLSDRRLRTLRELAAKTAVVKSVTEACEISAQVLADNSYDIPFALFYLLDQDNQHAQLVSTTNLAAGTVASPSTIDISAADNKWLLHQVIATGESRVIEDLINQFGALPGGNWSQSPHRAVVLPLTRSQQETYGFLIVGVSPLRVFDDDYKGFFDLIAGQVTTALTSARAYEAERKRVEALAELDRAKTTFFSNISHEFRTPLTLMLSPLEDALADIEATLPPQQQARIEIAQRNSLRLLKLVNTLLDFSQIEAGRIQASYEPVDLATLTAELASMFRSAIERANMRLIVDCSPLPERVYVDRQMWEKIILNLLSNAFKFTFSGQITVSLNWVNDHVELAVQDTGIGIPVSEIPNLFKRFHRVKGKQGRTFEGSGIGLSLVQELVKMHGGTITVHSIEGEGSCFTVLIPTGSDHLPAEQISPTQIATSSVLVSPYIEAAGVQNSRGDGEINAGEQRTKDIAWFPVGVEQTTNDSLRPRLLLADDNADMRNYLKGLLSQNYQVQAVADGVSPMQAIAQQHPDLVLLDVMMPGLDGFELLRQLREQDQTRQIPIILLSARAGEESRVEGLAAGADDYLIKPFSSRELLAKVESNLKLAQLRQEVAQQERKFRQETETVSNRLLQLLESMTDAFIALDKDWRIVAMNAAAERINHKPRAEAIGKTHWEEWPASAGTNVEYQYRRAMAEQVPVHFEHHYVWPPTYDVWLEIHAYPSPNGLNIFYRDITARKQSEAALRESEERFRQMAETIEDVFWLLDPHSQRMLYVSPAYQRIWGRSQEGLYTDISQWMASIHPEDRDRVQTAAAQCISKGSYEVEYRVVRPEQTIRWVRDRGYLIRDQQGQPHRIAGVAVDITNERQVNAALQESTAILNAINQTSPTLIYVKDRQGRMMMANPSSLQLIGKSAAEVMGKTDAEFLNNSDQATQIMANDRWVMETGQVQVFEEIIDCSEGRQTYLSTKSPYRDAQGNIIGLIGISFNITERKQAQTRISQQAECLQRLAQAALIINSTLSLDEIIHLITEKAREIIGAHQLVTSMTINQNWTQAIHSISMSDKYAQWQNYQTKPDGSGIYSLVCQIQRPMRMTQAELEAHPAWRGFGAEAANHPPMRGWLAVPMTSRNNSNIGVIQLSDKYEGEFTAEDEAILVQLAQMASAAIDNAYLYEESQRANRIKNEFLAVLSHELRSPLNPILGWSKLLLTKKLDAGKTTEALNVIARNAKLQSELIEDLLDVSRILQGKLNLNIQPVELVTTIQSACETVRLAAEAKSIQLQLCLDSDVGQVLGDSARLQQIFWNLLSNAVKFTPEGGQVQIKLEQVGSCAQITVSDTGQGIAADFLPYIFDYFRQADAATTRKFGGLGLGLAIVRHLVELHGGTVWATSAGEGMGATFTVQLPLIPVQQAADQDTQPSALDFDLNGMQILLVDDDADTREFVAFVLEQSGARVIRAATADEAYLAFLRYRPDVLLSDIGMPETDGYMLIRQIRSLPPEEGGEVKAIALTAYAGDFNRQQAIEAGFQQHISKPIEPEQLIQAIAQL